MHDERLERPPDVRRRSRAADPAPPGTERWADEQVEQLKFDGRDGGWSFPALQKLAKILQEEPSGFMRYARNGRFYDKTQANPVSKFGLLALVRKECVEPVRELFQNARAANLHHYVAGKLKQHLADIIRQRQSAA